MKVWKQEKSSKYNDIVDALKEIEKYCEDTSLWKKPSVPDGCNEFDYKKLLKC